MSATKSTKPTSTKTPKTPKAKEPQEAKGKKAKKEPKAKSGPGVIASILEFLQKATKTSPISKDALLAKLVTRFPDREEKGLKQTINCQVPGRLAHDKGVKIHKGEDGFWADA